MDAIFDYMLNNHDKLLYVIAAISLLIELTLIGLSGPLLFFSIACALTGVLVSFQIINGWEMEVLFVGLFSFLSAMVLWQPLKRFQGNVQVSDQSSDLIGQNVFASEAITESSGSVRHSGINWSARIDDNADVVEIAKGQKVVITGVRGNIILVGIIIP